MRALLILAIGAGTLLPLALRADEATLPDDRRLSGELRSQAGQPVFVTRGDRLFRLDELRHVRCTDIAAPPLRAAVVHQVVLRDGQRLTGELLGLDADTLKLRTVWSDRTLALPRSSVAEVGHLLGFATIFDDDFEDGLKAWKLTGTPTLSAKEHISGKNALLLDAAGQAVEYAPAEELEAGQARIHFLDPGSRAAGRWFLEAEFASPGGPRLLRIHLVGESANYGVVAPGLDGVGEEAPRSAGWHRLTVEFAAERLWVLVDERVLWTSRERGAGGPLKTVRLGCTALPGKAVTGKVWFDDFSLLRMVEKQSRPPGDVGRDEIWLLTGDQLFGSILRADRRTIEFQGRFGQRALPWSTVRSVHLRHVAAVRTTEGRHVRVQLSNGVGPLPDEVEGVLRGLEDRRLTLLHVGGEIVVPCDRLRQIQETLNGRRQELDADLHHLGREVVAAMRRPRPEGLSTQTKFALTEVPVKAFLVVEVSHLKGPGDGPQIADALERGGLRTEVVINGRVIDYLNRQGRSSPEPRTVRLGLPREVLRSGDNVIEIRQTLDRATERYEDCLISKITLELPH